MPEPASSRAEYAAYLALERRTDTRHEFRAGSVFARAGGTPEHDALASNIVRLLGNALGGRPCAVHGSDLKIRIEAVDTATYADAAIVCDARDRSPVDPNAVTNPRVLVEVTSPSSEAYDRGEKAEHYRRIPSLGAYLIVAHDRELIEVYERVGGGWRLVEARAGEQVALECVNARLSVSDVYHDPLGGSLARPALRRMPVQVQE
jgi:Uma2 family endonuclease